MKTSAELTNYVRKLQEGDREVFEDIYKMSYAYLHTCVIHVVKDEDSAQDILQETYLEVSRNIVQLRNPEDFLSWAAVIANRKSCALLKKRNRELLGFEKERDDTDFLENIPDNEEFIPENLIQNQEKQRLMGEIIDGLTDMQRLCVINFYFRGLSQEEIAEELGIPLNTVKSHLNRARAKIKDAVLELDEKKGTRLYSLAPFMLLLLGAEAQGCSVPAMSNELALEAGLKRVMAGPAGVPGKAAGKAAKGKLYGMIAVAGLAAVGIIWLSFFNRTEEEGAAADKPTEAAEAQPTDNSQETGAPQDEADGQEASDLQLESHLQELFVLDSTYESYGNAYGGSIPVKKDGMWGAVNYENEVIVPFEYMGLYAAPDELGNFVLYNSVFTERSMGEATFTSESREYFLFDNQGNVLYRGEDQVRASGGLYITEHRGEESSLIEYHSLDGTVLVSWECEPSETVLNGFYDGISNLYDSLHAGYGYTYGEAMGPYEDDVIPRIGTVDQQGNLSWREDPYYYIWWDEMNKEIEQSAPSAEESDGYLNGASVNVNSASATHALNQSVLSPMNHGYYITGCLATGKNPLTIYDAEDNRVATVYYPQMYLNENGMVGIDQNIYNDSNAYRGFWSDGFYIWNYGSQMVFLVDDKNVLVDLARNTAGGDSVNGDVVAAVYDYIAMADENYWLVQSGEQWGYIDHDGNEMAMFQDAGNFVGGYALVMEDGEVWLIDEEFHKLESLGQGDSVSALGELYRVTVGDEVHLYRF